MEIQGHQKLLKTITSGILNSSPTLKKTDAIFESALSLAETNSKVIIPNCKGMFVYVT